MKGTKIASVAHKKLDTEYTLHFVYFQSISCLEAFNLKHFVLSLSLSLFFTVCFWTVSLSCFSFWICSAIFENRTMKKRKAEADLKKKEKAIKTAGAPKRPPTAFFIFMWDIFALVLYSVYLSFRTKLQRFFNSNFTSFGFVSFSSVLISVLSLYWTTKQGWFSQELQGEFSW